MYTDYESWVKTINAVMWDTFFINETITSDWNILQDIISSLTQFLHKPTLSHVKGHQDAQALYTRLPLPAQLDVDTNCLALRLQALPDLQFNVVPAITDCNAYVSIRGNTIMSNFMSEL